MADHSGVYGTISSDFPSTDRSSSSSVIPENLKDIQQPCELEQNVFKFNRREAGKRVFVNRNVHLEKIKHFGFDMDYTLAEYKSPQFEELIFKLAIKRMIANGYPEEFENFKYDKNYAARGLIFDTIHGNFLKVDPFGNILMAIHGLNFLEYGQLKIQYPNRFVEVTDGKRFRIYNTLFELSEVCLMCQAVQFFKDNDEWIPRGTGFQNGHTLLTYQTIKSDMQNAIDIVHRNDELKEIVVKDISHYIKKNKDLPLLLHRMRAMGKKTFIATNSEYWYTNAVMSYLLDLEGMHDCESMKRKEWNEYFDLIIVEAQKPIFFAEGTPLCQIDMKTGKAKIGTVSGPPIPGSIYSGGSSRTLAEMIEANGKDILYVGDHIFGDILKSKKKQGWRTYLVIPELENEKSTLEWDMSFGNLGSLLRSGPQLTFFASQMMRYADLYGPNCTNLINYPLCYFFRATPHLLAHEATVEPSSRQKHPKRASRILKENRLRSATCLQEDSPFETNDV